ncbi:MAG TPA: hypothetical protein VIV09_05065 [Pseudolabrys sp.]|jgi:hypothetical protein
MSAMAAMGIGFHLRSGSAQAFACAALLVLSPVLALAQAVPPAPPPDEPGFFVSVGKWLDRQASGAKAVFMNLGHEAGIAAKSTAESAKDAADTLAKQLPASSVVTGHEVCRIAPNGAPDCVAAADAICKAKGFKSGKSVDMTTAETCPPKVYLAGRSTGPECKTETFVSSALCQ